MKYWRMAMRVGNRGFNGFDACRSKGIAAMDWWVDDQRVVTDCRRLTREKYESIWRTKSPRDTSPRAGLRHLWLDVKPGDIIYAKTGNQVVGKGKVVAGYAYDTKILAPFPAWAHHVKVEWEPDFIPFHCKFDSKTDALLHTILPLNGKQLPQLRRIQRAEKDAIAKVKSISTKAVSVPEDALPEDMAAVEGKMREVMVKHRQRERRLRDAKIRQTLYLNGDKLRCEVPGCGFDFAKTYGELGKDFAFVHHLQGLADRKMPSETRLEDLAIVCGNCHAMIHRDGNSRPLKALIRKS
jgi:hypothetical protein